MTLTFSPDECQSKSFEKINNMLLTAIFKFFTTKNVLINLFIHSFISRWPSPLSLVSPRWSFTLVLSLNKPFGISFWSIFPHIILIILNSADCIRQVSTFFITQHSVQIHSSSPFLYKTYTIYRYLFWRFTHFFPVSAIYGKLCWIAPARWSLAPLVLFIMPFCN